MAAILTASPNQRSSRWQWLVISALFLALLAVSITLAEPVMERAYDMESANPGGLLALDLWLEELGYQSDVTGQSTFTLVDNENRAPDLLFVYPNQAPYSAEEAQTVADWVEAGGTLVLIGPKDDDFALINQFGVRSLPQTIFDIAPEQEAQPLIPNPPDGWSVAVNSNNLDISQAPNAVPVLITEDGSLNIRTERGQQATMAIQQLGDGVIWHLSPIHAFTNSDLEAGKDGYILPALLRNVPDGGSVLFDTYHLYGPSISADSGGPQSLQEWLYETNPGRAILFGAILIFGFLLLQGIRLGPPLPQTENRTRREAAEYVVAMAGLRRRLGEPTQVATYQRRRLKQSIGKPLGLAHTIPDEEFIQKWQERDPYVSQSIVDEVTEILVRLSLNLNERTLVETAARIDALDK